MPRVYIGRLSYHVREKDIQRFFGGYGKLLEIDLKNGMRPVHCVKYPDDRLHLPVCTVDAVKKSQDGAPFGLIDTDQLNARYGFVEFEDTRDADDAVYELSGKDLCGERVIVEHARGPRRDRDGYGGGYGGGGGRSSSGYSSRSRSGTGREKYGPPVRTEYRLIVENLSSRCSWQDLKDFMRQAGEVTYADAHKERTNEGVIEFRSSSDMRRALDKLDGTDINGRKIRLVEDKPRRRRSYSGSRSRSRSRRRSHSRSSRSHSGSRSRSRSRSKHRSRSRSGRKSRSMSRRKSRSKAKSERDSRSRSKEKSRSRSASPRENGNGDWAKSSSRSPSPKENRCQSESPGKRSASRSPSRSKSRSRSRSASQD